ncbi:type II toxin-antitoxin system prevent-host-death family antitoxin [Saccharomonospora sp. NPDC046836]|uniref:type II toxin-antitoxin system Phd/YefM family antitoxin n=1 Tax=Saccharomonospora sp. NPDC046836 TaxID=3156921 RepID=UPI0033E40E0C
MEIGVRELRQHASVYLRRVAAGESFTVTDRGTPVAELRPTQAAGGVQNLLSLGELLPPERPSGVLSGRLPEPLDLGFGGSDELRRLRDEERW